MPTSRSRTPTPVVLQGLRGSPSRTPDVPAPVVEHIDPPEHLTPVAAEIWRDVVAEIAPLGLLTTLDVTALEMLCEAYSDWCAARTELANFGSNYYTSIDQNGNKTVRLHPAVGVFQDAEKRLRAWLEQFGLTPASRARWRQPLLRPEDWEPGQKSLDLSDLHPEERALVRQLITSRQQREIEE